jgi:hypothetical protein
MTAVFNRQRAQVARSRAPHLASSLRFLRCPPVKPSLIWWGESPDEPEERDDIAPNTDILPSALRLPASAFNFQPFPPVKPGLIWWGEAPDEPKERDDLAPDTDILPSAFPRTPLRSSVKSADSQLQSECRCY